MNDTEYMQRALELAKKGVGFVSPNPMVGAVIVKDGRIIGEGYHQRYGELHAERNALASLTESAEGATMYVTLEPCCHYGKTPPCTDAIIENGIARVVVGSVDPNPKVAGKGIGILRDHGIEVKEGVLKKECDNLNYVFFHYIQTGMPYVVMKYAMTADGRIATETGRSQWITGEGSRRLVHEMRHRYMGIMAGIGTVMSDDPMLNTRIEGCKSPVRIICDSSLSIDPGSRIMQTAHEYRTIIACSRPEPSKQKLLEELGAEVVTIDPADSGIDPSVGGGIDPEKLLEYIGGQGIDSVFIEGGSTLNASFIRAGLVDRLEVFVGPAVFGGSRAKSPVGGAGIDEVSEAAVFRLDNIEKIDDDVHITYTKRCD